MTKKPKEAENPETKRNKIPKPEQMAGDTTEFDVPKGLNKYLFIHVPKAAVDFLPFHIGEPLTAKIEDNSLVITTKEAK